jgi:hypothetical protein
LWGDKVIAPSDKVFARNDKVFAEKLRLGVLARAVINKKSIWNEMLRRKDSGIPVQSGKQWELKIVLLIHQSFEHKGHHLLSEINLT